MVRCVHFAFSLFCLHFRITQFSTGTMSSKKRKRTKISYDTLGDITKKNLQTDVLCQDNEDVSKSKQPILAPNGKMFYPCQYCCEIFPQQSTTISHMAKCTKKNDLQVTNKSKLVEEEFSSSCSSIENAAPGTENNQSVANKDASIYDYNEQDENFDETDPQEGTEENTNNRECKHCSTQFENPLDLLRHTRDCHNFPRKILPPDEIEKYFDYPNREFCPICEKPIKTRNFRSVFIKHLLVHTTGLTHECRICKKKFRRRDHMRAHEKRHIVAV